MIDSINWPNWWQWWLLTAITVNTIINVVVFFKHRFKKESKVPKKQYHRIKQGRPEVKIDTKSFYRDVKKGWTVRKLSDKYNISVGKVHKLKQKHKEMANEEECAN
jgi:hypothetical protein